MAFCKHCGAQNDDGAEFCKGCGSALTGASSSDAPAAKPALNIDKKWLIIGGAALAGIIILGILAFVLFRVIGGSSGTSGAEKAAKNFVAAVVSGDAEAVVNLLPEEYVEYRCDSEDINRQEFIDNVDEALEKLIDRMNDKYDDNWSITPTVTRANELTESKLDTLVTGWDKRDVLMDYDAGVKVKLDLNAKLKNKERTKSMGEAINFVKIGGKWYLEPNDYDCKAVFNPFL